MALERGKSGVSRADAVARFGRIDVPINNARYGIAGAVEETPEAELRAQIETNIFGSVAVTKGALPQLRAQGAGAIVNISTSADSSPLPGSEPTPPRNLPWKDYRRPSREK